MYKKVMSQFLTGKSRLQHLHKRISRAACIFQTPYRALVGHDGLNFRRKRFPAPIVKTLSEDSEWKVLEIDGFRFFWPSEYEEIGLRALYHDTFAPAECNPHAFEVGDVRIHPGDWVVDAGACEGFFTHLALRRGANVLMIEPVPRLAEALSCTFEQEMRMGRVRLLQGVVGANDGGSELIIPRAGVICATVDPKWEIDANWSRLGNQITQRTKIAVRSYTLDGILEGNIIPKIGFLKMDVENAEKEAIRGATRLLRLGMPRLSIAVYHEFPNAQIIRSMVLKVQPKYRVTWRGIFMRESFGPPRPYMLHAEV